MWQGIRQVGRLPRHDGDQVSRSAVAWLWQGMGRSPLCRPFPVMTTPHAWTLAPSWPSVGIAGGATAHFGGGTVQTKGRHVLEAFTAAGMDADTFGFDVNMYVPDRIGHVRELVARSRFAWVSANVREGGHPDQAFAAEQGARLWVVKQVGGVQVGITGVVSPDFQQGDGAHAARVAPTVALLDPVTALREVVPRMRAAGAQVVVVLSHLFFEEMEQVARQVNGVNAILGSHQGPPTAYLPQPEVIGTTILSKPGHDMAALGQLDLVVRRRDGRVVRYGFQRHQLTRDGPSSPAVKAILDRYLAAR
jgi:5'-nucleotidase / UDP-sugar diphosphatase